MSYECVAFAQTNLNLLHKTNISPTLQRHIHMILCQNDLFTRKRLPYPVVVAATHYDISTDPVLRYRRLGHALTDPDDAITVVIAWTNPKATVPVPNLQIHTQHYYTVATALDDKVSYFVLRLAQCEMPLLECSTITKASTR